MTSAIFGYSKLANENVNIFTISNKNNVKANILSFGAAIQSLYLPWSGTVDEHEVNVVLGYDRIEDYETNDCYIGVAVGRVAGRISHGCFTVEDTKCHLTINNGGNCLHGGSIGLSRKNWHLVSLSESSVTLACTSAHGEEGFPGDLATSITYSMTPDDGLAIEYDATVSGHPCPLNLTNHSYFNLSGPQCTARGIRDHIVTIAASRTLALTAHTLLPTGAIVPIPTQLDLRHNTNERLDAQIAKVGGSPPGFDNYYIFDTVDGNHCQATVTDGVTRLRLFTDQVGVQFYTANFFDRVRCAADRVHGQHGALCLEAQNYPDAVNHDAFPSVVVHPGQRYVQRTVYKFERV